MCHGCDTSKYRCDTGCVTHKTLFKHMKKGFYSKKCRSDTSFYYYYIYKYALVLKTF